jgi:hypothetical protein
MPRQAPDLLVEETSRAMVVCELRSATDPDGLGISGHPAVDDPDRGQAMFA